MPDSKKPNKRLVFTALSGAAVVLFRKNPFISRISQVLFVTSLNQWSKAEYIHSAGKFRKTISVAGMFIARTFAAKRKNDRKTK